MLLSLEQSICKNDLLFFFRGHLSLYSIYLISYSYQYGSYVFILYNTIQYSNSLFLKSIWEFAVWLRKLRQGLCISLERWDGEGEGREVQKGVDTCIPMAGSC